jgi:hypothetical protein
MSQENPWVATITVTDRPWSETRFIQGKGESPEYATQECVACAAAEGWSTPKWWQWWRRKDATKPYVSYRFSGCFDAYHPLKLRSAAVVHTFDEELVAKVNGKLSKHHVWLSWSAYLAQDSSLRLVKRRAPDDTSAELPIEYHAGADLPVAVTFAFTLLMDDDDNEGAFGLMSEASNLLRFIGRTIPELQVFTFGKVDEAANARADDDRFDVRWDLAGQSRHERVEGTWQFCR